MIIEDVLSSGRPPYVSRLEWNRINEARYRSRKFVFSPPASRLVGTFARDAGDLVIAHRQFARPPYADTYVEFSSLEFYDGARLWQDTDPDTKDIKTGYLITGNRVYGFAQSAGLGSGITPWFYNIVPPGQMSPFRSLGPFPRCSRRQQLALMLGSSYNTDEAQRAAEQLLEEVSIHYLDTNEVHASQEDDYFARNYMSFAGDVRNIWACLLWINQPTRTRFTDEPATRKLYRGKLTAYASHRVVEIDLGRIKTIRRAFEIDAPRLSPRGHEVRGYWQHHGGDKQCGHQWPLLPDEKEVFHCVKCGRLRWWNDETVRGDATRGWVTKEYELKWKTRWEERQALKNEKAN